MPSNDNTVTSILQPAQSVFYSSSRNFPGHEVRTKTDTHLHREYYLAMSSKSLRCTMLHRSIVTHA